MSNEIKDESNVETDLNQDQADVQKKKKIIWAKNRKESIIAIIVMILFFANTVYTIVKCTKDKDHKFQIVSTLIHSTAKKLGLHKPSN